MSTRRVYIAFSTFHRREIIVIRVLSLLVFYFLLQNYSKSPDLFLVLLIANTLFFLLVSYDKIKIYEDRMAFLNVSILSTVFRSKGTIYLFDEVCRAELPKASFKRDILHSIRFMFFRNSLFFKWATGRETWASFYLEMKDGNRVPIYTTLEEGHIDEVVEIINSRIEERNIQES